MNQPSNRIATLIYGHLAGGLGDADKAELQAWLDASEQNRLVFRELTDTKQLETATALYAGFENNKRAAWAKLPGEERTERGVTFMPIWKKLVAAAALVLLFAGGAWWWNYQRKGEAVVAKKEIPIKTDIAPGHEGAVLKLAGGQVIVLDSVADGVLARQGATKVFKAGNGRLVYTADRTATRNENIMNTLSTPRGRTFNLTLPDGTRVWLNAGSSISYPVAFTGSQRRVEMTGEAYFEVAKNLVRSFIVHIPPTADSKTGTDVQVLGTHFNVMAYGDESAIKTTLLEGSIKLVNGTVTATLKPGQQALVGEKQQIKLVENADIEQAVAWKNGTISFRHTDIRSLMRQVERWYDVDVLYKGTIPEETVSGDVERSATILKLLRILEASGIHCSIEGRKLLVQP